MNYIDFFIGLTLMNAMPHFILGVWKRKMPSGYGFGNMQNILWGLTNFVVSIVLFLYHYGFNGFMENMIYSGACFMLLAFWGSSWFWYGRYKD